MPRRLSCEVALLSVFSDSHAMDESTEQLESAGQTQESIADMIESATPLIKQFIENQTRAMEANQEIGRGQLDIAKDELRFAAERFNKFFWLVAVIAAFLLLMIAGLIFIEDNSEGGLSLLTHLGAAVAGVLAGAGWQRNQQR